MTSRLSSFGVAFRAFGIAALVLALAGRLVSGSAVVDVRALNDVASVLAASVPCQPDAGAPTHDSDRVPGPGQDAGLIAMASLLSDAGPTLLPAAPTFAAPCAMVLHGTRLPPARAPPTVMSGAAMPRGPPVLI